MQAAGGIMTKADLEGVQPAFRQTLTAQVSARAAARAGGRTAAELKHGGSHMRMHMQTQA